MGRSAFAASFDELATQLIDALFTHEVIFKTVTATRANPWEEASEQTETVTGLIKAGVLGPGQYRWNGQLIESDRRIVYVDRVSLATVIDLVTIVEIDGENHAIDSITGYPEGLLASAYEITAMIGG